MDDKIKGAASFMYTANPMEIEEIYCEDKKNLLDSMWLFGNIPWSNHDNKMGKVIFGETIELFYIDMDGFDNKTAYIDSFEFNNIEILCVHGFGGNSYSFYFKLGDESIKVINDEEYFAFSKKEVKKRYINKLKRKIKGLNYQINYAKDAIKFIKDK
jgi:hypothetical protein